MFEREFDILDARSFPAKTRFEELRHRGLDVLNEAGKPLRCWGYFGRQMVAALNGRSTLRSTQTPVPRC